MSQCITPRLFSNYKGKLYLYNGDIRWSPPEICDQTASPVAGQPDIVASWQGARTCLQQHLEVFLTVTWPEFNGTKTDKAKCGVFDEILGWAWYLPKSHCLEKQQNMTDLYTENYKILLKEIKGDPNNWGIYTVDGVEDSILLRCQFSLNYCINSLQFQSKSQKASYKNWQADSKIPMETQRT